MRTRTEIVVEIERCVVVQRQPKSDWCPTCLRQVEMIDEAALFAPEGLVFICPHSPNLSYKDLPVTHF